MSVWPKLGADMRRSRKSLTWAQSFVAWVFFIMKVTRKAKSWLVLPPPPSDVQFLTAMGRLAIKKLLFNLCQLKPDPSQSLSRPDGQANPARGIDVITVWELRSDSRKRLWPQIEHHSLAFSLRRRTSSLSLAKSRYGQNLRRPLSLLTMLRVPAEQRTNT